MPTLKELSIALGLLTSDHSAAVDVDGWEGYVWRIREIDHCISISQEPCKLLTDRWDWKRPQFYDISLQTDPKNNIIVSRIGLKNDDPTDRDYVCIVAAFLDKQGEKIGITYVNWPSSPGKHYSRNVPIRPLRRVEEITQVVIGSKQCDRAAARDAENFQRVRQSLKQR